MLGDLDGHEEGVRLGDRVWGSKEKKRARGTRAEGQTAEKYQELLQYFQVDFQFITLIFYEGH